MNLGNMWKQIKRRLRQKRRWLTLGTWFIAIGAAAAVYVISGGKSPSHDKVASLPIQTGMTEPSAVSVQQTIDPQEETSISPEHQEKVLNRIRAHSGKRDVLVQTNYICGEETEKLGRKTAVEILQLHREHPAWAVTLNRNGDVYFVRKIDDLSARCRENAYFGIDKNGNLSLFDGLPAAENVLRTFFQLNIEYLETSLPKDTLRQLREGIRITDVEEYNSVLSTFSDFALEQTERVMKPAP